MPGKPTKLRPPGVGKAAAPTKLAAGAPNDRLAAQNRKLLGKHYTAKYGVRKG